MKVAVDLDNTVCDSAAYMLAEIRSRFKSSVPGRRGRQYDEFLDLSGATGEDRLVIAAANAMAKELWFHEDTYLEADLVPGALEALALLSRLNLLAGFVTHRHEGLEGCTGSWLSSHVFPALDSATLDQVNVVFVDHETCKSSACTSIGANVLIEDNLDVANRAAEAGLHVILLNRVYNGGLTHHRVTRAKDWPAALFHIGQLFGSETASNPSAVDFPEAS